MSTVTAKHYPVVFVHGMFGWGENEGVNRIAPYWGGTTGSIVDYLREINCDCYAASVGPLSGAWDQACELYAQLMGTVVDYGKVHSERYGHKRYGRRYNLPMIENWSAENKIHLVGHSFGGNAVRMLTHLLTHGAPKEVEASGDDVSPLFKGGNEALVCSVTTLCSPLNGTSAYETADRMKIVHPLRHLAYIYAGVLGRSSINGRVVDFHLEQFDLTHVPGRSDSDSLRIVYQKMKDNKDNIEYDMSPEGARRMNENIEISPNVYYFSYPFNSVRSFGEKNVRVPVDWRFPLLFITSSLMIANSKHYNKKGFLAYDYENDGLVNVRSQRNPHDEPKSYYTDMDSVKKGEWTVMPVTIGDHGMAIGLFANKEATRSFYIKLVEKLRYIEKKERT